MSRRLRTSLLLGCLGVGLLYAPDCARILEGELPVLHAAEWQVGPPYDGEVAQRLESLPMLSSTVVVEPEYEEYVGGE